MDMNELPDDTPIQLEDGEVTTLGQLRAKEAEALRGIYMGFAAMRDKWVQHRAQSQVEGRWRRAMAMYSGDEEGALDTPLETTLKLGPTARGSTEPRSRVTVNIVRPRVDQAVARMCEILLPTDDQNWGIRPTPVPEMIAERVGDTRETVDPDSGEPTGLTADEEAQFVITEAKKKAEMMQTVIGDVLTECNYNAECRKGIHDGVLLGTMIMEGPVPAKSISKVWAKDPATGKSSIQVNEKTVPASRRLDPWDVFFDPACGSDHQRGAGYWVRRFVTRKELRQLVGLPGYDAEAIREVLRLAPNRVRCAQGRVIREMAQEDSYEMWTYHGEVEPEEMKMVTARGGNLKEDVSFALCVMVNDRVIAALDSWVADGSLPVDVWNWREADDSPYGYGLAHEHEHQQRVINSAWRMVMDNGRAALGSQVVFKKGLVNPKGSDFTVGGGLKLWEAEKDVEDVNKAFAVFDFPSHLQELIVIAEKAMQFSDQETSMPQLLNGNMGPSGTPETVGGMVMLYNNANTVLRFRVKKYDDRITRPHIGRHYDYQMANSEREDIKGDMEVDARGASSLIERDIQNQATLNLAAITSNERYANLLEPAEELKAILKAFRFAPESLMKSKEKLKQEQDAAQGNPPPEDPRIAAAKINAETNMAKIADNEKARELQREQLEYNRIREQGEFELTTNEQLIKRDTALLKINSDERRTQAELAAEERLNLMRLDQDRQLFNAEAALRVRTGAGI